MSKAKPHHDLCDTVMSEIKRRDISIRPKRYFLIQSIIRGISISLAIIATIIFMAMAVFHIYLSFFVSALLAGIFLIISLWLLRTHQEP